MHSYRLFGLCLHSDLEFPGFPRGGDDADVRLRCAPLASEVVLNGARRGDRVAERLYHEPTGSDLLFEIRDGAVITVHPLKPIDEEVLRGWVTSIFFSVLLRQRGAIVLHASAAARGGEAVAFVGRAGQGKSTMAEFCRSRGYTVLTDDVLALRVEGGEAWAYPSYPFIRLREKSAQIVEDFSGLPVLDWKDGRRVRMLDQVERSRARLRRIYVLEGADDDSESVVELSGREGVLNLLPHVRSKDLLTDPPYPGRLLEQLGDLVRTVPVGHLRRVRALDRLPNLLRVVEHDVWDPEGAAAMRAPAPPGA